MGMFTTLLHSVLGGLCGNCETEPQSPLQRSTQQYEYQQGHPVTRPLSQKPLPPPPLPRRPSKAPQPQYYPSHLVTRPVSQTPYRAPQLQHPYQQGRPVTRPVSQKPYESPQIQQSYQQGRPVTQRASQKPIEVSQLQHPYQQDRPVTRPASQKPYEILRLQHPYQQGRPVTRPISQKPYESPQIQQSYQQGRPVTQRTSQKPIEVSQFQHPYQQDHPVTRPASQKPYEIPQPQHTYPPVRPKPEPKPQPARCASPGPQKSLNHENQQESHYQDLRARANEEGSKMQLCCKESRMVYAGGDRARAKELSNEGKAHKKEMERLNAQASEWIFAKNNKDRAPGEVDLHGLYVKEAITYSERAIKDASRRGDTKINLIVGQGLHSQGGVAKLKPAIENFMRKQGLVAELHPKNPGVLVVNLDGRSTPAGLVLGVGDISRRLEDSERFGRPRL